MYHPPLNFIENPIPRQEQWKRQAREWPAGSKQSAGAGQSAGYQRGVQRTREDVYNARTEWQGSNKAEHTTPGCQCDQRSGKTSWEWVGLVLLLVLDSAFL